MKTPALDSAASQIAAMKDGKISATELLDRYLERIDRRNPKLNAVSHMDLSAHSGLAGMAFLPATVAPIGICPGGMPAGIQIIGPYLEDRTAMAVARQLEDITGGFTPPPGV